MTLAFKRFQRVSAGGDVSQLAENATKIPHLMRQVRDPKEMVHSKQATDSILQSFVYRGYLRIGSCLACVYRVMDARGKFGEHERSVRVARGDSREQL